MEILHWILVGLAVLNLTAAAAVATRSKDDPCAKTEQPTSEGRPECQKPIRPEIMTP